MALVAFPFAEGTEILEGARASLLEEPYLRFAGAWSKAKGIGVEGLSRGSVTSRSQESKRCSCPTQGAQGHTHAPLRLG